MAINSAQAKFVLTCSLCHCVIYSCAQIHIATHYYKSKASVKRTIKAAHKTCHVEVTTLVIHGENESDVEDIAKWLSEVDPEIPYHLSRFFPKYKYADKSPTPPETMCRAYDTAKKYLKNVFSNCVAV